MTTPGSVNGYQFHDLGTVESVGDTLSVYCILVNGSDKEQDHIYSRRYSKSIRMSFQLVAS